MAVSINIDTAEEHLTPALSPSLRDAERELIFRSHPKRANVNLNGDGVLADISHMVSCPRTAWVVFVIFCLLPDYASLFSSPLSVFVRRGRCFDAIVGSNAIFRFLDVCNG
jgi:hypothetical protein